MNYTKFILILVFVIFSCKNSSTDKKLSKKAFETKKEVKKKNIQVADNLYQLPEYFNPTAKLGLGLLKPKNDTLFFRQQEEDIFLKETIYTPKRIIPIFFKPDYDIFYIVCTADIDSDYKVLSANEKEFLVNKEDFNFVPWEKFLLKTTGIENINWEKNPLRKEPTITSIESSFKHKENFIVKQVKDDWINIENEENEKGWIRWKEKDNLLIEMYLLM